MEKLFYLINTSLHYEDDDYQRPADMTDERFKEISIRQSNVYTATGLCFSWNADRLPSINTYIRFI